jgi:hypothetical protein
VLFPVLLAEPFPFTERLAGGTAEAFVVWLWAVLKSVIANRG